MNPTQRGLSPKFNEFNLNKKEPAQKYNNLKSIPVNKNQKFESPLASNLFRTGTLSEGSCFFHSILHSVDDDYVKMDKNERMNAVADLRKTMKSLVTPEIWTQLGGGMIARVRFDEIFRSLLEEFYKVIDNLSLHLKVEGDEITKDIYKTFLIGDNPRIYKMLKTYISLKDFEKYILPQASKESNSLRELVDNIVQTSSRFMSDRVLQKSREGHVSRSIIRPMFDALIHVVSETASTSVDLAYQEYLNKLGKCSSWVDNYLLGIISDMFDLDIYVIDDTTRLPYILDCEYLKKRPSVVIMWTGGDHYESVGEVLDDKQVKRLFDHKDQLIQKMYHYIC